jgi:hypothetical protein
MQVKGLAQWLVDLVIPYLSPFPSQSDICHFFCPSVTGRLTSCGQQSLDSFSVCFVLEFGQW